MTTPENTRVPRSTPVLQALLLADQIYTDESGKRIICGTFSKIFSVRFPTQTAFPAYAFVLLADVVGEVSLQLRFVNLFDNEILMESATVKIESNDPLTPLDIVMQVPPFPLPREGVYSFECWTDDTMTGSIRIQAAKVPSPEEHPNA